MSTSPVSNGAVNANGTAATNGTASINGTISNLDRGLQLAAALAAAPDVTINPPVDLPDHYPDEPPALDYDHDPEAAEVLGAMDAREYLDRSDRLTLAALVDAQADFYRGWRNPAGVMLARHMDELAMRIRWVHAETPGDFEARLEIVDRDARESWWQQGFEEGRQRGRSEAGVMADGQID
jgi:hypothetical protein